MTPDGSPVGVGAGASFAADSDAASARAAAAWRRWIVRMLRPHGREPRVRAVELRELRRLAVEQRVLDHVGLVAVGDRLARHRAEADPQLLEPARLGGDVGARLARVVQQPPVALRGALEELDPLEQVAEAGRAEDHRDQVRLPRLVGGDEVVRQGLRGGGLAPLQLREPDARADEVLARALEVGLALVDARLQRREPRAGVGEPVARGRDPRALGGHGGLELLGGGLLVTEVLRGGGGGEGGGAEEDGERDRRGADGTGHGRAARAADHAPRGGRP